MFEELSDDHSHLAVMGRHLGKSLRLQKLPEQCKTVRDCASCLFAATKCLTKENFKFLVFERLQQERHGRT